jgi:hypothetical protein
VDVFHGRQEELRTLLSWLEAGSGCRLISVLGLGGIGKTSLVTRLLQGLVSEAEGVSRPVTAASPPFRAILWRSVRNAPRLETLLGEWLSRLAPEQAEGSASDRFLRLIRERRCLFVLDNFETLLDAGVAGSFRPDHGDYGDLVRMFAETHHRSLLILTSREKPLELERYEGGGQEGIRTLRLGGSPEAAKALLAEGRLRGSMEQRSTLTERCGHSPLAVKIVAAAVRELFGGDITAFLRQEAILLGGLRPLLERQFERLSALERTLMRWLAIRRDWTSLEELLGELVPAVPRSQVPAAMQGLQQNQRQFDALDGVEGDVMVAGDGGRLRPHHDGGDQRGDLKGHGKAAAEQHDTEGLQQHWRAGSIPSSSPADTTSTVPRAAAREIYTPWTVSWAREWRLSLPSIRKPTIHRVTLAIRRRRSTRTAGIRSRPSGPSINSRVKRVCGVHSASAEAINPGRRMEPRLISRDDTAAHGPDQHGAVVPIRPATSLHVGETGDRRRVLEQGPAGSFDRRGSCGQQHGQRSTYAEQIMQRC